MHCIRLQVLYDYHRGNVHGAVSMQRRRRHRKERSTKNVDAIANRDASTPKPASDDAMAKGRTKNVDAKMNVDAIAKGRTKERRRQKRRRNG